MSATNNKRLGDRLSKNEFAELIPHLDLKEILAVEFYIKYQWNYLFEERQTNTTKVRCNLCSAIIGGYSNVHSHLEGKKHKLLIANVWQLYHAEYTYPKSSRSLRKSKAVTSASGGANVAARYPKQKSSNTNAGPAIITIAAATAAAAAAAAAAGSNNTAAVADTTAGAAAAASATATATATVTATVTTAATNMNAEKANVINEKNDCEEIPTTVGAVDESVKVLDIDADSSRSDVKMEYSNSNIKAIQDDPKGEKEESVSEQKDIDESDVILILDDIKIKSENVNTNLQSDSTVGNNKTAIADNSCDESQETITAAKKGKMMVKENTDSAQVGRVANKRSFPNNRNNGETVNAKVLRHNEGLTVAGNTLPDVHETAPQRDQDIVIRSKECRGLLGVEYVIKIIKGKNDLSPRYECALCKLVLAGRLMQHHLECYNHRLKFCEKHFPATMRYYRNYLHNVPDYEIYKVLSPILAKLSVFIEEYHGRRLPFICLEQKYNRNRQEIISNVGLRPHASEICGPTFTHIINSAEIDKFMSEKALYKPLPSSSDIYFDKEFETMETHPASYRNEATIKYEDNYNSKRQQYVDHPTEDRISGDSKSNYVMDTNVARDSNSHNAFMIDNETHKQMVEKFLNENRQSANRRYFANCETPSSSLRSQHTSCNPWQEYCSMVDNEMDVLDDSYKRYWQDPESHPKYNSEWKAFWKRRKNELIAEGIDYQNHNFQLEWVQFFKIRIKELYYEDANILKYKVLVKLALPRTIEFLPDTKYHIDFNKLTTSTQTTDTTITINEREQKQQQRQQKQQQRQLKQQKRQQQDVHSPQLVEEMGEMFNENKSQVVSVLRIMAALEDHLGSLGPKIICLLSKALQLEKNNSTQVNSLILNEENCCIIETAKEKFKGVILAGLFEGSKQRAITKAIHCAESLLDYAEKIQQQNDDTSASASTSAVPKFFEQGNFSKSTNSAMSSTDFNRHSANDLSQMNQTNIITNLGLLATQYGNMNMDQAQLQQLAAAYTLYDKNKSNVTSCSNDQLLYNNFTDFMKLISTITSANNETKTQMLNLNDDRHQSISIHPLMHNMSDGSSQFSIKQEAPDTSSSDMDIKPFNLENTNVSSQMYDNRNYNSSLSDTHQYTQSILTPYPDVLYNNNNFKNANVWYNNNKPDNINKSSDTSTSNNSNNNNNNSNNNTNHTFSSNQMQNTTTNFADYMQNANYCYGKEQYSRNSSYAAAAAATAAASSQCDDNSSSTFEYNTCNDLKGHQGPSKASTPYRGATSIKKQQVYKWKRQ